MKLDKLIFANILSMDLENPVYKAIGIKDGKIAFLGGEKEGAKQVKNSAEVLEIRDKTLLPGFIDTHVHAFPSATVMSGVNLAACKSIEEVTDALQGFVKTVPPGLWVFGNHFQDKFLVENRFPTLAELDAVSTTHPIGIIHNDFHPLMFNSYALRLLNLDPVREGVRTDEAGNYTGIVSDPDHLPVLHQIVAQFSPAELLAAFKRIEQHALKNGFTTICIKEGRHTLKLLIENRDKYQIYLKPMLAIVDNSELAEVLAHPLLKDDTCICAFADGSFDAYTGAVFEPYENDRENFGILLKTNEELYTIFKMVHDRGLQFSCHAIGDRAIQQVLDVAERVLKENPRRDHRHRIEHFEMPTRSQIDKAAKLGMALGMQPLLIEVCEGMDMEGYRPYIGERVVRCSPYRSILDKNILVGGGSDFMVTDMLALRAAQICLTHPVKEERISLHECLEMYTREAAKIAFLENRKGCLKPGMDADLVIIGANPYQTRIEKLSEIEVEMTIYQGEIVYKS